MSNEIQTYEIVKTKFELSHFKILNPLLFAQITANGTLILRNETRLNL